jgi:hypothetical protein
VDAFTGIDVATDEVAADAECECAFLAGADLARIGDDRGIGAAARLFHQHRAWRLDGLAVPATGGEQYGQRGTREPGKGAIGHVHPERRVNARAGRV